MAAAAIDRAARSGLSVAQSDRRSAHDRDADPKSMRALRRLDPAWGITGVRLMMGLILVVHGVGKFAAGLPAMTVIFTKMAIIAPQVLAPAIATLELAGGVCLMLGLLTRVFGLLFVCEMLVTTFWVQLPTHGWHGSELDRMLLVSGVLMVVAGPGRMALDRLWLEQSNSRAEV